MFSENSDLYKLHLHGGDTRAVVMVALVLAKIVVSSFRGRFWQLLLVAQNSEAEFIVGSFEGSHWPMQNQWLTQGHKPFIMI